jgi:hypothetical protein
MTTIKLFSVLLLFFCFISCRPQNSFINEYINLIGQYVPDSYIFEVKPYISTNIPQPNDRRSPHEFGNVYSKNIKNEKEGSEIYVKLVADDNNVVQSCYITFTFLDFMDPVNYHKQLCKFLNNNNWQFIKNIAGVKNHAKLYIKDGIYFAVYDPIYFSIPVVLSNSNKNFIENTRPYINKVEMIYPIEYYKNEIINYQDNYYGFKDISMEITQIMNISSIIKADNIIHDLLTFVVCWFNPKGYVYYLYGFNTEQNIVKHYYLGDFVPFENYHKLTEKLYSNILEYAAISINDFNNNGKNEIALYSFYKNIGNVFCVYGFSEIENELVELCLVPVFINYDNPFSSVEYIENGFKVLEIIDEEIIELTWNKYVWENDIQKYVKQ